MAVITLAEFVKGAQEFLENNPDCADLPMWSARDAEGNGFTPKHDVSIAQYFKEKDDTRYAEFIHDATDVDADDVENYDPIIVVWP